MATLDEPQNFIINEDDNLVELLDVLEGIDENKKTAELNAISMIDSKGGRTYF